MNKDSTARAKRGLKDQIGGGIGGKGGQMVGLFCKRARGREKQLGSW